MDELNLLEIRDLNTLRAAVREGLRPKDLVWGIGLAEEEAAARDPEKWKGLNLLGFALIVVRERLEQS